MFNSRIICIVYLDVNRFDFYVNGAETVLHFDFSPVAANLEITNHEELAVQIKAFIDANKIPLSNVVIILSENIVFVKALAPDQDRTQEVQRFISNIPFEHISQRIYPIENGALIVAANHDFYGALQNAFEKNSFTCDVIVPIFTSGITTLNPQAGLDIASAKGLIASYENLRQNSLENKSTIKSPISHTASPASSHTKPPQKKSSKRALWLVGIFGALIVILVIMLLTSSAPSSSQKNISPTPHAFNTGKTRTVILGTHTESLSEKTIQIVIQFHENNSSQAALLKSAFTHDGFKNVSQVQLITPLSNSALQSGQPLILFSPNVSLPLQNKIEHIIQLFSPGFAATQLSSLSVDATISL